LKKLDHSGESYLEEECKISANLGNKRDSVMFERTCLMNRDSDENRVRGKEDGISEMEGRNF